ncbi:hypothetical protein FFF34_018825 [Inquilinus sp. KBS0705]|nr:hypothetical protein FFF34_018825 [Inquilinus sp. KBS0705]
MKKAICFLLSWLLVTSCAKVLLDSESCISEIKRTFSVLNPDLQNQQQSVTLQHANSVPLFNTNLGYNLKGDVYPTNINAKHSRVYFPVAVIITDNSKTQPYFNGIFTPTN